MKMTKNAALLAGVAVFTFLFYHYDPGVSLGLFGVLVWALVFIITKRRKRGKGFWWLNAALALTIAGFAWYADFASFVALFFTLVFFILKAFYPRLNILCAPLAMIVSGATSPVRMVLLKYWLPYPQNAKTVLWKKIIAFAVIPLFFAFVFIGLYSTISNRFASYFTIDWDFSRAIIFASRMVIGFFFMYNFVHLFVPRFLLKANTRLQEDFSSGTKKFSAAGISGDRYFKTKSGEISLVILNTLLLFFLFIYSSESAPRASFSSEVHERVYVLMASIAVAVAIIMMYFYTPENFKKQGRWLRTLSYIWMALNAALVILAALKTSEYVHHYGLTFKRVGVYVFLMLCMAGLIVTSYKLMFVKTNVYLLNRMAWIFFVTMVIGFNVNWSWVVTRYNLSFQAKPDVEYLMLLRFNKIILYNALRKDAAQQQQVQMILRSIQDEKTVPLLSGSLYFHLLQVPE